MKSRKAKQPVLLWFRRDLRLADNPSLRAALETEHPIIPVYIHSTVGSLLHPGSASKWWLHQSLKALTESLRNVGNDLILRPGDPAEELFRLVGETNCCSVFWNIVPEPDFRQLDATVIKRLRKNGIESQSFEDHLLIKPELLLNRQGKPYQVFTPFWKACMDWMPPDSPLPKPRRLPRPETFPTSLALSKLNLLPTKNWAKGFTQYWKPGEQGARSKFKRFLGKIEDYDSNREIPGINGTSQLSPHLHFGELSTSTIWHKVCGKAPLPPDGSGAESFLREIGWREFAYYLLHHFPHTVREPLREKFASFPWEDAPDLLNAWQKGMTGYPIIDAGMRELWQTGWMHNRVRMIVASFLVKDLRISWLDGAAWFMDTLVDADTASNTLGWQWTAGCGADAAPFFRIFNPVSQGEKFDPEGHYIREFVPELKTLPRKWIHQPWRAPESVLQDAGIALGENYPHPIVDHKREREKTLSAFRQLT